MLRLLTEPRALRDETRILLKSKEGTIKTLNRAVQIIYDQY
jgi:hypothetical protein